MAGSPTFREGKVQRLQQWLNAHNKPLKESSFYSDSFNDIPLLETATFPVATNPDSTLLDMAEKRGWKIIQFNY
ncbi:HAD family hydrolase [Kistimonas scapharcae]|uniref:HAD family hydrolase n=1 Tax=Kistimonas scapharcae TaxID=1036133 RepID=UPI003CD0A3B4